MTQSEGRTEPAHIRADAEVVGGEANLSEQVGVGTIEGKRHAVGHRGENGSTAVPETSGIPSPCRFW